MLCGSPSNAVKRICIVLDGGALYVEYLSDESLWRELALQVSDGVDQTEFDFHAHPLPADARHEDFRVRLRTDVNGLSEDWFVDDLTISAACAVDAECDDGIFCNGAEACTDTICTSQDAPCNPSEICDEFLTFCYDPTCAAPTTVDRDGGRTLAITVPPGVDPIALLVAPQCNPADAAYVGAPDSVGNIAPLLDGAAPVGFDHISFFVKTGRQIPGGIFGPVGLPGPRQNLFDNGPGIFGPGIVGGDDRQVA